MTKKDNSSEMKEEKVINEAGVEEAETKQPTEIKEEDHKKASKRFKKDLSSEKIEELEAAIAMKNDQLLRLHAEFDNYRKRTLKEKMELTKSAGESILVNILPVLDDFERALKSIENTNDVEPLKDGVNLIYKRFNDFIKSNGIKEIEAMEKDFDTDQQEAITKIPSPSEELKGKVVDVIQKGYLLNDKVIRFAKVVIGE